MSPITLYAAANAAFAVLLAVGIALGSAESASPLYLVLLFGICSTPILNMRRFNDRYALLAIFSAVYFLLYGMLDLFKIYAAAEGGETAGTLSATELVILVGGALTQLGYRLACRSERAGRFQITEDWPERTLVLGGCVLWCVATWLTWEFRVKALTSPTASEDLEQLGRLTTMVLLLANMLQPLAIVILAYAHARYRRAWMLPIVIGVVLFQLALGFIIDVKADALIGAVLVVVTRLFVDARLPKGWLISSIVFVAVAFPALQANRNLRNLYGWSSVEVARNLPAVAREAFSRRDESRRGPTRAQSIFERLTLKGSVEMIVTRTGNGVPFQRGYTLTPIYLAFVPRLIWPEKPNVPTGQLVNREFGVTNAAFARTYISPSHLGELYWNFGWLGVIVGMTSIGLLLGFVGMHVDMSRAATITQLLIATVTIEALILRFEGQIAGPYVVWLRSLAAIALLHLVFAQRIAAQQQTSTPAANTPGRPTSPARPDDGADAPAYPNLMR